MNIRAFASKICGWFANHRLPVGMGLLAFLVRIPFSVRYDLHFQSDAAIMYLMAKRVLKGELSFYFWNQEHYGTLVQLVTAAVLAIFSPSIVVASLVTAAMYASTAAVATGYVQRHMGLRCGVAAGVAVMIGVPLMHHYTSMPSDSAYTFSLLSAIILVLWGAQAASQPVSARGIGVFAFVLGLCWYLDKHILIGASTIGLAYLITARGRLLLRSLLKRELLVTFVVAFLVGYSPELIYKATRKGPASGAMELLGLASPEQVAQNFYWAGRGIPAYFDGDPLARTPEGVHYLRRNENVESLPQSLVDWIGIVTGIVVLSGIVYFGIRAWRAQNHPELILALYPFVNVALVAIASVSHASYYSARRYLFSASIVLFMWWGICIARALKNRRSRPVGWLLGLTLVLSLLHQATMLRLPDELADYRSVAAELDKRGIRQGISWYSIAHVMTALTNEKTTFATIDYGGYKVYQEAAFQANELGLVYPTSAGATPERISIVGKMFVRHQPPSVHGELSLAVYQRTL